MNWEKELDRLNYWQSRKHIVKQINYNNADNLNKILNQIKRKADKNICNIQMDATSKINWFTVKNNLIDIVEKFPNVEFVIVIAPQARYSLVANGKKYIENHLGLQQHLVKISKGNANVRIFSFDNDDQIVNNVANYRDSIHYHSGVNEAMLRAIAMNDPKTHLTISNADVYFEEVLIKLCQFKVHSDFNSIIPLANADENETLRSERVMLSAFKRLETSKTLITNKKFQEALHLLDQLVLGYQANPLFLAKVFSTKAEVYNCLGKNEQSILNYDKAIELQPREAQYYIDRGKAYLRINDIEEAKQDFEKSIEIKPNQFPAYRYLGNLHAKKGELESAIKFLTKSIELNPKSAQLYLERANLHLMRGDKALAKKNVQKALKLKSTIKIPKALHSVSS